MDIKNKHHRVIAYDNAGNEINDCGHEHRTIKAALKCQRDLRFPDPDSSSCISIWYNSSVSPIDLK